jgi:hypothetical protein
MVNKSKGIGTMGERYTLRTCLPYYPKAHRLVLAGNKDQGDIRLNQEFIVEGKAGAQTRQFGDKTFIKWVSELYVEMGHSSARFGFLTIQRHGYGEANAHRWWSYIPLGQLTMLTTGCQLLPDVYDTMVRLELGELLNILAAHGHTDAVPDAAAA